MGMSVVSGHLEAFTRAKLKLLIVTFSENVENQWYQVSQSALTSTAEKILSGRTPGRLIMGPN